MDNSFTIKQNLTFGEFLSATLYYYLSRKLLWRFFLLLIILGLLSILLGQITTSKALTAVDFIPVVAPLVILFLIAICFYIYKGKPYLFHNVSYDFTHWGVVRHGEKTDFSKPWRNISKIKETKAFFFIYVGKSDFHIIQKRMFANMNELNDFRSLLKEKTLK